MARTSSKTSATTDAKKTAVTIYLTAKELKNVKRYERDNGIRFRSPLVKEVFLNHIATGAATSNETPRSRPSSKTMTASV